MTSIARIGLALAAAMIFVQPALSQSLDTLPFSKKLKLAKVGDEDAQMAVAAAYENGTDTILSRREAAKWYRLAAQQGNIEAQFRLARIVHDGDEGLKKSPEMAAKLYEAAAKQGHVEAQNWLGYSYQHGLGFAPSDADAVNWYRRAADAGLAMAENNLGLMYLNGKGVAQDRAEAFRLFERAALKGDSWGLNNLGGLHEMGWGTARDSAKALAAYKSAAEKGNDQARKNHDRLAAVLAKSGEPPTASTTAPSN